MISLVIMFSCPPSPPEAETEVSAMKVIAMIVMTSIDNILNSDPNCISV